MKGPRAVHEVAPHVEPHRHSGQQFPASLGHKDSQCEPKDTPMKPSARTKSNACFLGLLKRRAEDSSQSVWHSTRSIARGATYEQRARSFNSISLRLLIERHCHRCRVADTARRTGGCPGDGEISRQRRCMILVGSRAAGQGHEKHDCRCQP